MPVTYALIHEEAGSFGISFPDFPGAVSGGDSAEEAICRGSALLTFHVADRVEAGESLPRFRSLAELRSDPTFNEDAAGATLTLVSFDVPGRAVRVNVSMDEYLLAWIDKNAEESGQSRSGWLSEAARHRLRDSA